ncbi:related to HOL1 protein [Cephalotrichum gorgonifer]|uniref:Related to HOL1 protein n=1 Tax=Cephalotrichum gorgonifer TaxID=2041049 RepID=A0AAE8MVY0_9PEZI|nr:related to HOL1 protein [Cephalotrichum gorgonifer]
MGAWKHAFSLSAEEIKNATPPGTVRLIGHDEKGGDAEPAQIRRFPVPSADPADPLNWAPWRKFAALLVGSVYAFTANFISSNIAPALTLWFQTFPQERKTYPELVYFIAVTLLWLGASNIFWMPLANWAGRRPVLLASTLLMTLSSMWAGLATSYGSLLAARMFQGIGGGAADTVAPALVGDMYFLHERGRAMAVYTVFLCIGPLVGGITGGYTGFELGWAYNFWIATALSAGCFLGILFLSPETLYDRPEEARATPEPAKEDQTTHHETTARAPATYGRYTFVRSLGFRAPSGPLLPKFVQPWRTLALPGTWVVMLHYSGLVGGVVTISTVGAQLVQQPPYLWGANAGLINVGALVGAFLGYVYTHAMADGQLKRRAKRDALGLAEPEDRLPIMFAPLVIATCGFFVFGFCAEYPGDNRWVGLEVGYGMLTFGLMQVPSVGFNYLIDSYGQLAPDCFVVVTILRAIIAFAWTFFVSHWVEAKGPAEPFGIFGMLMGLFSMLTVPLWLMVELANIQIGRFRYNSPWTQVTLVGFVAFCSVGIFSALGYMGAGGMQDVQLSMITNAALYSAFFFMGFFGGSINNILGPRLTMSIGVTGYVLYVGGLWCHQETGNRWFLIFSGVFLGIIAALFWAAHGAIMMSYPAEKDKGRSFTVFWALFQLGSLMGSAITLGIQFDSDLPGVSTAIYIIMLVIMLTSIGTSWLILPPQKVVRSDGTHVEIEASISPGVEFREFVSMFKDWRTLALFPMCFSSNYFYAYQGAITAYLFNGRTRALVALASGLGSVIGSVLIGLITDNLPFSRRKRSLLACGIVFVGMCGVWGAGLAFQVQFKRGDIVIRGVEIPWDWEAEPSVGPILLIFAYYIADAAYQGLAYYTMSCLTNSPFKLARMAGYYKGIQSAGAAVSFGMDAVLTPYLTELLVSWIMPVAALPLTALVLYHARETNYDVEGGINARRHEDEKSEKNEHASPVLKQAKV